MKKLLITTLLLLNVAPSMFAELKKHTKDKYYTVPADNNIDQDEYHNLVLKCHEIMNERTTIFANLVRQTEMRIKRCQERGGSCGRTPLSQLQKDRDYFRNEMREKATSKKAVVRYLSKLNTPTSLRLIDDLQAIDFSLFMDSKLPGYYLIGSTDSGKSANKTKPVVTKSWQEINR